MFRLRSLAWLSGSILLATATSASAAQTAFRINSMYWRDPHLFVNFLGCRDVTDIVLTGFSFNSDLNNRIQTDTDGDGKLDINYLIVFNPLDQVAPGGPMRFVMGSCTAPMAGTTCSPVATVDAAYSNSVIECLGPLPGTVRPYAPAVTHSQAPCFVAPLGNVTLLLGNVVLSLRDTYVAATYSGNPATGLVNGLMRGFLTEATANATILPASMPFVGGQALSSLLPGGTNCCAAFSDKDVDNDIVGWYVYFNFTAVPVTYNDPLSAAGDIAPGLTLDAPHPNPFNPSTEIRYVLPAASPVEIAIYDATGRMVRTLANAAQPRGEYSVRWDGRDAAGAPVSSGVYFVKLNANGEARTQKMVLLK